MKLVRQNLRALATLFVFGAISAVAAGYILLHERVPNPFEQRYSIRVELLSADAVAPGFGQPVTVAGVQVGEITAVEAKNGRAIVTATIRRHDLPRVRADATAVLAPRTPLKDMELELTPGTTAAPVLHDGALIPLARTQVPIDSDELTAALDGDTRAYLLTLIDAAGDGLRGRGGDLRLALHALRPTVGQLDRISAALASRRTELADLIHNFDVVSGAVAREDPALARTIEAAGVTLQTTASQDHALGSSLAELPPTLATIRLSLAQVRAFADASRPAALALTPPTRKLAHALHVLSPVLDQTRSLLHRRVEPLTPAVTPVLALLRPSIRRLSSVTPSLTRVFGVLDYLGNELAYNPGAPHGYLFWLAWTAHNALSIASMGDANGTFIRGYNVVSCSTTAANPSVAPAIQALAPAIAQACPKEP